MDLGPDPEEYIEYGGRNSFYFKEVLEETLLAKGARYSDDELEALFKPFLAPDIRRIVEMFQKRDRHPSKWRACTEEVLLRCQNQLHSFDKRRLHYLRFGRVDIGNLEGRPWKFLNILLEKSRDEIEHTLQAMEQELPPHEIRPYLYTALELQTHFRHLLIRNQPVALDPEKVDHFFLEDLCRLNRDEKFFRGVSHADRSFLHPYLVRYLVLYFDHVFDARSVWDGYVEDFMWRHQFYRTPRSAGRISTTEQEACRCLGICPEDFRDMDRHALTRCFRQRAKETHPDTGGDEVAFVEIREAYECLMRRKY
jgi:hypothetical protein